MPLKSTSEKEEFRFTWHVENFKMCHHQKGVALESPSFIMGLLEKTEWQLKLYPRGSADDHVACELVRENDSGPNSLTVHWQFSLGISSGAPRFEFKSESKAFTRQTVSTQKFIARTKLLEKEHLFLPLDTLTVICDLWTEDVGSSEVKTTPAVKALVACLYNTPSEVEGFKLPKEICISTNDELRQIKKKMYPYMNECSARTKIGVERRALTWPVRRFSSLKPNSKVALPVACPSKNVPEFTLLLYRKATDDNIQIDIRKMIGKESGTIFLECRISVLDVDGRSYLSKNKEYCFASPKAESDWSFPTFFTRNLLIENKRLCLPNDELTLRFEFTISTGIELSQVEEFSFVSLVHETSTNSDSIGTLAEDLKFFYSEDKAFDFSLKVNDVVFPAHRAVLCFRSPVLCAMLDHDTLEKKKGVVDIPDMDPKTMSRMLEFMYTDSVDIVRCDGAMKLYTAADKYQIRSLRQKCSTFLQGKLTTKNVFDVLVLADRHQDEELLKSVQKFLFEPPYNNLLSVEFETFIACNTRLAHEILRVWIHTLKSQIAIGF